MEDGLYKMKSHLENRIQNEEFDIPQDAIDSLARRLYPAMRKYFESEEGRKAFEEWKRKRKEEAAK